MSWDQVDMADDAKAVLQEAGVKASVAAKLDTTVLGCVARMRMACTYI